jgi:hypothetical protein
VLYLCYLCLFAYSGVQYIWCFVLFFVRLVHHMLPINITFLSIRFIIRICYGYSCVSYFYKPGCMKSGDPEGCKTEIKVKEQCLYICSTFHRNRRVFNNEHMLPVS